MIIILNVPTCSRIGFLYLLVTTCGHKLRIRLGDSYSEVSMSEGISWGGETENIENSKASALKYII